MSSVYLILALIEHHPTPWILSGLILICAVVVFWIFSAKLTKVQDEIHRARNQVKAFKEKQIGFADLSAFMRGTKYLGTPWKGLEKSLISDADELDGSETVFAPQRVSEYFNDHTILSSSINLRWYQGVPNVLVGVGLLFTFVGLVMALYYASKGVAAKEVEEAQAALRNLLDAATFKFLTSLAGLLSSLVFSLAEKARLHKVAGEIEKLAVEIEASLARRSLEQMAHQRNLTMRQQHALMVEQLDEARQQTAQIKRFETDFAVSIASALDNRLGARFDYLAATLSVAIDRLGLKIGSVNEEALQTMIGDFRKTLTEGTGSEIAKMAELVGQLSTRLELSGQNLEEKMVGAGEKMSDAFDGIAKDLLLTGNGFKEQLQEAGQEMSQTFSAMSGNLLASGQQLTSTMQKAGEEIAGSAKLLDGVLVNLKADLVDLEGIVKQTTETAEKTTTLLSQNVTDLATLHGAIGNTLHGLQGVGATIESTTGSLSNAIVSMTQAQNTSTEQSRQLLETARAALGSIQTSGHGITSVTSALRGAWESYQSRFEGVDDDLERVFGQIQMGLEQYADKVREFQSSLDSHLSTAMQSLGALVQELSDTVEELHEAK